MARILLVEDEGPLLTLLARYLTRAGYKVDACSTAAHAWNSFDAEPDAFAAIVTDLTLPDGSGDGLIRRMLKRNAALRVVICTGYPFDIDSLGMEDPCRGAFLQKPFLPKVLGDVLQRFLQSA